MRRETFGKHFLYRSKDGGYVRKNGEPCCRRKNRDAMECTRAQGHAGQHRADDVTTVKPWGRK